MVSFTLSKLLVQLSLVIVTIIVLLLLLKSFLLASFFGFFSLLYCAEGYVLTIL